MKTYWIKLKNGDIRYQERIPKNKPYVFEETEEIETQTVLHKFDSYDNNGNLLKQKDFISFCGFDRGPKHNNIVSKLIK